VLDNRPGSGRELGGTEVMEAKRGKLKSGVHPLWLHKAVDGGGTSYERSGGGGEAVGAAKWRRPRFKRGRHGWHCCSDRAADGWAPVVSDFFFNLSKIGSTLNSK
jgi:hypothetical protein